jgi:hypothetical protein
MSVLLVAGLSFIGGVAWNTLDMWGRRKKNNRKTENMSCDIINSFVINGMLGLLFAFAVIGITGRPDFGESAQWIVAVTSVLAGYCGADIIDSLFELNGRVKCNTMHARPRSRDPGTVKERKAI